MPRRSIVVLTARLRTGLRHERPILPNSPRKNPSLIQIDRKTKTLTARRFEPLNDHAKNLSPILRIEPILPTENHSPPKRLRVRSNERETIRRQVRVVLAGLNPSMWLLKPKICVPVELCTS